MRKMINKDLIELQRNCSATCAVILTEDCKKLENSFIIDAKISYTELNDIVKKRIIKEENLKYLIIKGIDKVEKKEQEKYVGLVKDRIIFNNYLPQELIIVFTVENSNNLKQISKDLYHFCVVALEK